MLTMAPSADEHGGDLGLQAIEDRAEVDVDDLAPVLRRLLHQRNMLTLDAGIVVREIETAEARDDGGDKAGHSVLVADIGSEVGRLATGCDDRLHRRPPRRLVYVCHRYGGPGAGEGRRTRPTDARTAARDERDLAGVLERDIHGLLPCRRSLAEISVIRHNRILDPPRLTLQAGNGTPAQRGCERKPSIRAAPG